MIAAFVNRRPWVAALIALIFSPLMGMLYLGRWRWGLLYLLVTAAHLAMLPLTLDAATGLAALGINICGAVHCYRIAYWLDRQVPRQWFARWYALFAIWLLPVLLAFVVRIFLWEPFNIPAASMEPTLQVGDHLFVSKFAYNTDDPQRGDLVVFLSPEDNQTAYVKRLVGLPGDHLQWQGGVLYLNGVRLPREEVAPRQEDNWGTVYREVLPSGRSYLIREIGDDHRFDNTDIYEAPEGHYFFVGDSLDSRSMLGFVPRANFVGKIVLIYWNSEAQKLRFVMPE